jgi:hypothetical protein
MEKKPNRILVSSFLMTVLCIAALALIAPLPGGGWWFGAQVQNVSSTPAVATITVYDFASGSYSRWDSISPGSYQLYQPTNFPGLPDNFQGSSIVSSNQDIRAIVNLTNRYAGGLGDPNSSSPAAGQYQGANVAGSSLYFPLVKNDYYTKTTTIIVQNVGTIATTANATFTFLGSPYTYYYYSTMINPHQLAVFDPIDARHLYNKMEYHPPIGNISSAVGSLTVTASQNLAGIALEHLVQEDHATVLQSTRGLNTNDYDTKVYAPINKNYYYDRVTGLQVQNVSGSPINITVVYEPIYENTHSNYCPGGDVTVSYNNLPEGASHTFDITQDLILFPHCFAPATITASGNIVAVVNEAFTGAFLAQHPGHAREDTAYNAIPDKFASQKLSVPLFKEDSYSKATGLSVQNNSTTLTANVVATFKNSSKTFVTNPMTIPPKQAIVLQDMRLIANSPPPWWHGWDTRYGNPAMNPTTLGCDANGCGSNGLLSVTLTSDQNIVGIANESTYPIQSPRINQDKSNYEAFNLTP